MNKKMIYEVNTHSLYYKYKDFKKPNFSIAIDSLEVLFDLENCKLIGVEGYFPLINAAVCNISLPKFKKREFCLQNFNLENISQNVVYELSKVLPSSKYFFEPLIIKHDKTKGIILIGKDPSMNESALKINDNIICGLDNDFNLKTLYLIPDKFI